MPWWGWVVFGAFLLGSELLFVDAAFYLVFIGASAIFVGLLGLAGVTLDLWAQWLLFSVLAVVTMVFFRKSLYEKLRGGTSDYKERLVGDIIHLEETIGPGESCRLTYQGTTWTVVNRGTKIMEKGSDVAIDHVDGTTIIVLEE